MRRFCLAPKDGGNKTDTLVFFALTVWPAINIGIIIYNYIEFERQACSAFMIFSKCVSIGGFLLYGLFSFVVYKLRQSHAEELSKCADRIEQNYLSIGEAEAHIRQSLIHLHGFRTLSGTWGTFSISIGVLGICTQLYWNYRVIDMDPPDVSESAIVTYAVMIWSEKLQFVLQPLVAMGGINVDYLWRRFKRDLTERLRDANDSEKVDNLLRHMKQIDTSFKWIKSTAALTLVSLYLGLQLQHQNLYYWIGPTCNVTALTQ